ncbi:MAG: hypothetical protein ACRDRN_22535, partial [Sciscionella sp.]
TRLTTTIYPTRRTPAAPRPHPPPGRTSHDTPRRPPDQLCHRPDTPSDNQEWRPVSDPEYLTLDRFTTRNEIVGLPTAA